jgi:DNA-binding transcriptional LysR family regulator
MELRHLRYFAAVAETGNLSRAAEKLFIAQPPLSVQIRQLEEELGQALFTRHPKGVRLTAAGQALLPEARYLVDRAARVVEVVRQAGKGPSGNLSVGFVPSASSTVLPVLVRQLRRLHAGVNLELREMISSEQIDALVAGHIDAGIARTPTRHPRLAVASRMPDAFCLAVPSSQARALPAVLDLRHFADADFIAFTRHRGPAYFDQSIHLCSQAGFSPRVRYEATTVHGVLDLVSAELGVALVPASTALLGIKGVTVRPLRKQGVGEVLALLRRKVDPNPLLPFLESTVEQIFADLTTRVARATVVQ